MARITNPRHQDFLPQRHEAHKETVRKLPTRSYNAGAPHLGYIHTFVCYHNFGAPHLTMIVISG